MTTRFQTTSTETELVLKIQLGSRISALRPAARLEGGSPYRRLDEDTVIGIVTDAPCSLRLRLVAVDESDEPILTPMWTLRVATRDHTGLWTSLSDRSSSRADYVTDFHVITELARVYRLQIGLAGTSLSSTYEITVDRTDPRAADDDHDVLFDPEDDLKPKPKPIGSGVGVTEADGLSASG